MAKYEAKTNDDKCPFCEIAEKRIKTSSFWEDSEFMAFLSIDPNTEGFSVVMPKKHFGSDVLKMPNDVLQRFIVASKKVSQILENYYDNVERVGLIMEGLGINHAHIKLIPMHGTENLEKGDWDQCLSKEDVWFDKYEGYLSSAGGPRADCEKLNKLAENLKNSI